MKVDSKALRRPGGEEPERRVKHRLCGRFVCNECRKCDTILGRVVMNDDIYRNRRARIERYALGRGKDPHGRIVRPRNVRCVTEK